DSDFNDSFISSNVHTGWIGIVRRLRFIDIVIWLEDEFTFADFTSGKYLRTIGNHLINVHIGLRPRTRLPDDQRELVVQFTLQNLITNSCNGVSLLDRQCT